MMLEFPAQIFQEACSKPAYWWSFPGFHPAVLELCPTCQAEGLPRWAWSYLILQPHGYQSDIPNISFTNVSSVLSFARACILSICCKVSWASNLARNSVARFFVPCVLEGFARTNITEAKARSW